jgi:hypothetical protein
MRRVSRPRYGAVALALLLLISACGHAGGDAEAGTGDRAEPPHRAAGRNTLLDTPTVGTLDADIGVGELRHHLSFLASDELRGRELGTDGVARAEDYIASQFEALGLEPVPGGNDYFLEFDLFEAGYDPQRTFVRFGTGEGDGAGSTATVGRDFQPFWFSRDGSAKAEMVFAGYGITAPEYGYDDYEGLDVEGKIVFVLRHEPNENDPDSPFDGAEHSEHAFFTAKAENASRRGAAAMLLVTDPLHHDEPDNLQFMRRLSLEPDVEPMRGPMSADVHEDFVAVHVSQELGATVAGALGGDLADMQRALDSGTRPAALGLGSVPATVAVATLEEPRRIEARNVAAYLPAARDGGSIDGGSIDEDLILIGAHHDHLGDSEGAGDTIYNGADDNASGTAGVLELAERFAREAEARQRGMIFATFSAEEWGLFGARAIVEEDLLPVGRIGHVVNLDMIGRNSGEPVRVYGGTDYSDTIEAAAATIGIDVELRGHSRRSASDHTIFLREDIPALFFHTGLHDDYHEVTDEVPLVEFEHMADVVRLVAAVVRDMARELES